MRQCPEPLPEGISRYGVIPRISRQRTSHGIARRLPAAGEGFAVMSGCAHGVTPVQGSLFYPTRNFATLGIVVTPQIAGCDFARSGHFCLTPHVAMRIGLYLRSSAMTYADGAWRAVSEDPTEVVSC